MPKPTKTKDGVLQPVKKTTIADKRKKAAQIPGAKPARGKQAPKKTK